MLMSGVDHVYREVGGSWTADQRAEPADDSKVNTCGRNFQMQLV